jgi:hypothetical protein
VLLYGANLSRDGVKEHKYVFQTSANEHSAMALFVFLSYGAMVIVSAAIMSSYGLGGFLILWLLTEIIQLLYILRLNQQLFAKAIYLDMTPVYRLAALLAVASGICFGISSMSAKWPSGGPSA